MVRPACGGEGGEVLLAKHAGGVELLLGHEHVGVGEMERIAVAVGALA